MRVGSFFTGIGGFDLGFERAGMDVAWQSEVDDKATAVLEGHWSDTPNLGDITELDEVPDVDLFCGGFPCQDISVANSKHKTREGLKGDRSGLWFHYSRLIGRHKPRWVVIENVPGLLSSNRGGDMATVVGTLAGFGYGVGWRVLDSRYFGVPQRRRRVFIVGHLGNGTGGWEVLSEPEGVRRDSETGGQAGEETAREVAGRSDPNCRITGTLTARTRGGGYPGTDDVLGGQAVVVTDPARPLSTRAERYDYETKTFVVQKTHRGRGAEKGDPDLWQETAVSHTLNVHDDTGGPSRSPTQVVYGFDAWRRQVNGGVRRLTPLECERLQGFPDGWTDNGQADTHRYRQLGNAVTVNVAEWIGRNLVHVDSST